MIQWLFRRDLADFVVCDEHCFLFDFSKVDELCAKFYNGLRLLSFFGGVNVAGFFHLKGKRWKTEVLLLSAQ